MRLIERLPSPSVEARAVHAQALFRCGYMQRAQREYRTLIADEPRNGDLRADFGAMLLEAAKYNEADEVLSAGVDSGGARVGLVRAQLLSATGHLPDAMELMQSLTSGNTQMATVAAAFGVMEQSAGRKRRGEALLTRAALMDPNNEDFRDALATIERERAGQVHAESEYRQIQGAQSEDFVRLSGQGAISLDLSVVFSGEQDHVSIRNLQRLDGSRGAFDGVERRSEAAVQWESEDGMQLKGSLFMGGVSHGVGVSAARPDLRGSTSAAVEIGRPDWDFSESLAQGGVRDRLEIRRDTTLNSRIAVQLGAAVNRYDLPGLPGAAASVAASGSVNVKLLRAPQLSLNYSIDGEYLTDAKVSQAPDGHSFRPLPLVSREVHAASVQFERQLTRGLHATGAAGVAVDRLGGSAPYFSGSITYDRSRHLGARVDYDRRAYKYDSRQISTSLRAGVLWRF
jgi:Tfp pilus assembly protein PilF